MADPKKKPSENENESDELENVEDETLTYISNQAIDDNTNHEVTKENVHNTELDDLTEETGMD